jgi:hypothetical protein
VKQFPGQIHISAATSSTTTTTAENNDDDTSSSSTTTTTTTSSLIPKSDLNAIGKFLVQQKKEIRDTVSSDALVLQTQLHLVEQESHRIMAQHIAEDPPKALMAIIQPSNNNENSAVAGCWQGPKRNISGGGAPCPSEFLLKREKRQGGTDGPSRQHPRSAKEAAEQTATTASPATSDSQETANE